jgi:hypothetical protein
MPEWDDGVVRPTAPAIDSWLVHAAVWAGLVLLLLVAAGVAALRARVLGVILLALAAPALVIALAVSLSGRSEGKPVKPVTKLLTFAGIFGLTVAANGLIAVLLIAALWIALAVICGGKGSGVLMR